MSREISAATKISLHLIVATLCGALMLWGCGDDNPASSNSGMKDQLIGTWAKDGSIESRQFNEDGTWIMLTNNVTGKWKIKNGKIIIMYGGEKEEEGSISEDGATLTLKHVRSGEVSRFKKRDG